MLTQRQVVPYLLERGLIDPSSIVNGDLTIAEVSRRNHNFKVVRARGPSYLLKQGITPDTAATVAREAAIYELFNNDRRLKQRDLSRYLPQFYNYDFQERILVLELVRDAEDFRKYHIRRRRFSTRLASMTGQVLAEFHSAPELRANGQGDLPFQYRAPKVFTVHRPDLSVFRDASEANLKLIGTIQQSPEFGQMLDDLRRDWTADRLIHHDVRWDNWLVAKRSPKGQGLQVKLVDWEFSAPGDPCWDVGSVFSGYLSFWLSSIPITGGEPPERFLELCRYPLDHMQPAFRSFWKCYLAHMALEASVARQWLLKSVRYGAARLVQTAFENMQRSNQLDGNVVCLLQLSLNIMKHPHEALQLLLGIPLQESAMA